jgi:hypothetical protein
MILKRSRDSTIASMHPELQRRFEALEERRKALVARVEELPAEQQTAKPGPNQFSPVEVIMHMALAEQGNVSFMRKTPPSSLKGKKPKTTFIFRKTVQMMEKPAKQIRTVPYMIPRSGITLSQAKKAWEDIRSETAGFMQQVEGPDEPMVKFLFFFGLGSASDYLRLIESHTTYHEQRFPAV